MNRIGWVMGLLGGCAVTNDGDLEASTASDLAELSRSVADLSTTGGFEGVGDCHWTWTVTDGDYAAALDTTPCGASISGVRGEVVLEVTSGALTGTVGADGSGWTYDLGGTRTAETTVTSTRRETENTYDGSWTLVSLVGSTPGIYDAELAYTGWFGGDWTLLWSRAEDGAFDGTMTGPRGRTCTIAGNEDQAEIVCDE